MTDISLARPIRFRVLAAAFAFFLCVFAGINIQAQTTDFVYQGRLQDSSIPANGNFDFEFLLFDQIAGGPQIESTLTRSGVAMSSGVFSVRLDFGSNFPGANRFLEIHVRPTGGGAFTSLTPRQSMSSTPYAIRSLNAARADAVDAGNITGVLGVSQGGTGIGPAPPFAGSFLRSDGSGWTADGIHTADIPSGSTNYIQNSTFPQAAGNFNIAGTGTADVLNVGTQFNIAGSRILSNAGFDNLFVGDEAGIHNTGSYNSFVGSGAGSHNSSGFDNSFFGLAAGGSNITGTGNSIFGRSAGLLSTSDNNSFFGAYAGFQATGGGNAFFGMNAGISINTGNNNTFIGNGANSGSGMGGLRNSAAIGALSSVSQDNSLVLGSINGVNGSFADVNVGIGTTAPQSRLDIAGTPTKLIRTTSSSTMGTWVNLANTGGGRSWDLISSGSSNSEGAGKLLFFDETAGVTRMSIDTAGLVAVNLLGSGGTTTLCRNPTNQISNCSSSIRYKKDVNPFSSGLSLIKQLRPVSFSWRSNDQADLGLVAEDVASVEPLLTTTNDKGEVEGVKYDRVGVVLVNAVQEQQRQIEAQQKLIETQDVLNKNQQAEIEALKALVCSDHPTAAVCKTRK